MLPVEPEPIVPKQSSSSKRNARRRKKKKKKPVEKQVKEKADKSSKSKSALMYLKEWEKRKETGSWKFKKTQQIYLLRNGLKMEMSENEFEIYCRYMSGLAEKAKTSLQQSVVKSVIENEDEGDEELQRKARQLIQFLSIKSNSTENNASSSEDDSE